MKSWLDVVEEDLKKWNDNVQEWKDSVRRRRYKFVVNYKLIVNWVMRIFDELIEIKTRITILISIN